MKMISMLAFLLPCAPVFANPAESVQATYEIPAPDSLKPYANVAVSYDVSPAEGRNSEVRYVLPATLLGHNREFVLNGYADPDAASYDLHGVDADMHCENGTAETTCKVTHHNVMIDLPAVKAALAATALPQREKDGRFALASFAARMGGDLVGVFHYPKD